MTTQRPSSPNNNSNTDWALPASKKRRLDHDDPYGTDTIDWTSLLEADNETRAQGDRFEVKEPLEVEDELSEEQKALITVVLTGVNVFYTGGAGTGKSTVLKAMVKELRQQTKTVFDEGGNQTSVFKHVEVVTPTGISAVNADGVTYYTWAGWNPNVMKSSIEEIRKMAMTRTRRKKLWDTDILIIDEISMIEANQFGRLDQACRAAHYSRQDQAFGGIQIIVTGDFYQLPPVKPFETCYECGTEMHKLTLKCMKCKRIYDRRDQWAFRSDSWRACDFRCMSLKEIHRQSDPVFITMLNKLRKGERLEKEELDMICGKEHGEDEARERLAEGAVVLSPIRREVDERNRCGFRGIEGRVYSYDCVDYIDIKEHHEYLKGKEMPDTNWKNGKRLMGCKEHRLPARLETKCGMPVILLSGIGKDTGLVNGSQGRIIGYQRCEKAIEAKLEVMRSSASTWEGEREKGRKRELGWSELQEAEIRRWAEGLEQGAMLPMVRFENGMEVTVFPVCIDSEIGDPRPFSIVARTQIPLLPAWAITIHKSQGMTLEKAVVDMGGIFQRQMAYVALSRVRRLDGLKVIGRRDLEKMLMNERRVEDEIVVDFMSKVEDSL